MVYSIAKTSAINSKAFYITIYQDNKVNQIDCNLPKVFAALNLQRLFLQNDNDSPAITNYFLKKYWIVNCYWFKLVL